MYESMVRESLVSDENRPVGELHSMAVGFVCAAAQSRCYDALLPLLGEEETAVLKRGRNSSSTRAPRSSSVIEYRRATAVEALLGYVYLSGERERLCELVDVMLKTISGDES